MKNLLPLLTSLALMASPAFATEPSTAVAAPSHARSAGRSIARSSRRLRRFCRASTISPGDQLSDLIARAPRRDRARSCFRLRPPRFSRLCFQTVSYICGSRPLSRRKTGATWPTISSHEWTNQPRELSSICAAIWRRTITRALRRSPPSFAQNETLLLPYVASKETLPPASYLFRGPHRRRREWPDHRRRGRVALPVFASTARWSSDSP